MKFSKTAIKRPPTIVMVMRRLKAAWVVAVAGLADKEISPVPFPMSSMIFLAISWVDVVAVAGNARRAVRTCVITCALPLKRHSAGYKKPSMCQRLCPVQVAREQARPLVANRRPAAPARAWVKCARNKDFSPLSAPAPAVLAQGR